MVLFETHCHTDESSACGKVPAKEVVKLYREAGYAGLVVTDHFNVYNVNELPHVAGRPWEERVHSAFSGYHLALEAAAGSDFVVLQGAELRFEEDINDYLVYGADEDFYLANPDIFSWGIKRFSACARERGFLLVQAHPFRNGMTICDPALLDMVEISNGNQRQNSRNEFAFLWAKTFGLAGSSGSDFHRPDDVKHGGVFFEETPETIADFIRMMKEKPRVLLDK